MAVCLACLVSPRAFWIDLMSCQNINHGLTKLASYAAKVYQKGTIRYSMYTELSLSVQQKPHLPGACFFNSLVLFKGSHTDLPDDDAACESFGPFLFAESAVPFTSFLSSLSVLTSLILIVLDGFVPGMGSTKAGLFTSLDSAGASLQSALEEVDSEINKRYMYVNLLLVICRFLNKFFLFLWLKTYQFLIVLDKGLHALIKLLFSPKQNFQFYLQYITQFSTVLRT